MREPKSENLDRNALVHWKGAKCILAQDYDGHTYPGHSFSDQLNELTCTVCRMALDRMNRKS